MSKKLFWKTFICVCVASVLLVAAHGYCQSVKVARLEAEVVRINTDIQQASDISKHLSAAQTFFETEEFFDKAFVSAVQTKQDELHTYIDERKSDANRIYQEIEKLKSMVYIGNFEATAYCYGSVTSTGTTPRANHTIAVDPTVIPYGTVLYVDGYGYYVAEDCGGSIKGNDVDIYMGTYDECINFGRRNVDVYIVPTA